MMEQAHVLLAYNWITDHFLQSALRYIIITSTLLSTNDRLRMCQHFPVDELPFVWH